jgi:hypothetical protein
MASLTIGPREKTESSRHIADIHGLERGPAEAGHYVQALKAVATSLLLGAQRDCRIDFRGAQRREV